MSRATGGVRGLAPGVCRASVDFAWGGIKRLRALARPCRMAGSARRSPGSGQARPSVTQGCPREFVPDGWDRPGTVANPHGVTRQRALLAHRPHCIPASVAPFAGCLATSAVRRPQPHRCARRAFWGLGARVQSFGRGHLLDRSRGAPALPRARLGWPVAVLLGRRPESHARKRCALPHAPCAERGRAVERAPYSLPPCRGLARPLSCPSRRWAHCIAREPRRTFVGMALSALRRAQACHCGRPAFASARSRSRLAWATSRPLLRAPSPDGSGW